LIQSLVPMASIEGQPRNRIGDNRPMTREQLDDIAGRDQPLEKIE
jgi:hypothetical protein